jgi:HrpA-like RNA helicase
MLLLLLRTLTGPGGPGGGTKLVVMSATLQAGLFGDYFATPGCPAADAIFVGARRFPVKTVFLDGLLDCYAALRGPAGSAVSKLLGSFHAAAAPVLAADGGKFVPRMRAQVRPRAAALPAGCARPALTVVP